MCQSLEFFWRGRAGSCAARARVGASRPARIRTVDPLPNLASGAPPVGHPRPTAHRPAPISPEHGAPVSQPDRAAPGRCVPLSAPTVDSPPPPSIRVPRPAAPAFDRAAAGVNVFAATQEEISRSTPGSPTSGASSRRTPYGFALPRTAPLRAWLPPTPSLRDSGPHFAPQYPQRRARQAVHGAGPGPHHSRPLPAQGRTAVPASLRPRSAVARGAWGCGVRVVPRRGAHRLTQAPLQPPPAPPQRTHSSSPLWRC